MVSRRSTRMFEEEQDSMDSGQLSQTYEDENARTRPKKKANTNTGPFETRRMPLVDIGKDISGICPTTSEDLGKQVIKCLQAAKVSTKSRVDNRPINFGTVIPENVYRSSFPLPEDFSFLKTLGLKTVLSLVKKDPFPTEFETFMRTNGVRHCVVEMQGTKKAEIPESTMRSIMEIVLDKENYPILIHCNHGKHRTGCAVAVVRHVIGWDLSAILEEYEGFAAPKSRDCDIKYITEYQISSLQGLFLNKIRHGPVLTGSKMSRLLVFTAVVLSLWITTAILWQ